MGWALAVSALSFYTANVVKKTTHMKPYPLGIDNPYVIRGVHGTTRWGLYDRQNYQKIAEFASQLDAYDARRHILKSQGYNA